MVMSLIKNNKITFPYILKLIEVFIDKLFNYWIMLSLKLLSSYIWLSYVKSKSF